MKIHNSILMASSLFTYIEAENWCLAGDRKTTIKKDMCLKIT